MTTAPSLSLAHLKPILLEILGSPVETR